MGRHVICCPPLRLLDDIKRFTSLQAPVPLEWNTFEDEKEMLRK